MTVGSLETIFHSLNDAGVRYLVVGGLAVVAQLRALKPPPEAK